MYANYNSRGEFNCRQASKVQTDPSLRPLADHDNYLLVAILIILRVFIGFPIQHYASIYSGITSQALLATEILNLNISFTLS